MQILTHPTPTAILQAALQRSIDLVSFGLQVSLATTPPDLSIPSIFVQLSPAINQAMDVDTARRVFQVWVLANGFRDIVDSLGSSLEWARKTCYLWSLPGAVTTHIDGRVMLHPNITEEDWNSQILEQARRFERLSLPDKLTHLEKVYKFDLPSQSDAILSLNAARNCLTHRNGIVGPPDLKDPSDKGLVIKIRKPEFFVVGKNGERVITEGPTIMNAGETMSVRFVDAERIFRLGERIIFTSQEYMDVCATFLAFGLELNEKIIAFQDRRRSEVSGSNSNP